jgi:hypothetical protein
MNMNGSSFFNIKNSAAARCLKRSSSQPSIETGTEPELRMAVGSWLRMVEGRYHLASLNRFYPFFMTVIKNKIEEAKLFSPCSYLFRDSI